MPLLVGALVLLAAASFPARDALYLNIATGTEASPFAGAAGWIATDGMFLLVGSTALLALWCWTYARRSFWTLTAAGAGVITAYLVSELIKLLVTEQRPCRALNVETVLPCPGIGDWSWTSNHSTVAAAFATACILAVPHIGWIVGPIATLIGFARVAAGVHYVHDVFAGFALGVLTVALMTRGLRPAIDRLQPTAAQKRGKLE